jgi:hypothetical protein
VDAQLLGEWNISVVPEMGPLLRVLLTRGIKMRI